MIYSGLQTFTGRSDIDDCLNCSQIIQKIYRISGFWGRGLSIDVVFERYGVYSTFDGSLAWKSGWRLTGRLTYRSNLGGPEAFGPARIGILDKQKIENV